MSYPQQRIDVGLLAEVFGNYEPFGAATSEDDEAGVAEQLRPEQRQQIPPH